MIANRMFAGVSPFLLPFLNLPGQKISADMPENWFLLG